MSNRKDEFGDRIKAYEARETERLALRGVPLVARVDGRGFSKFTRGMARPFDQDMAELMAATAEYLLLQTNAAVAYTQSDEISLILDPFGAPGTREIRERLVRLLESPADERAPLLDPETDPDSVAPEERAILIDRVENLIARIDRGERPEDSEVDFLFAGRFQKLTSVIAGLATARFVQGALSLWPERCARQLPIFDCRVFEVPTREEAVAAICWREADARKNAISMAARAHFPHARLQGRSGAEMQDMLIAEKGINFNDYPARFKRGVYIRKRRALRPVNPVILARIPAGQPRPETVERTEIVRLDLPPISTVLNRTEVLLDGAEPVFAAPAPAV